jgi:hypothetical protein
VSLSPDRRELLAGLVGLALGGASLACRPSESETLGFAAGRFSAEAKPGARELGRQYLDAHPEDRNPRQLAKALAAGRWRLDERELQQRIREEFARGEVVSIDGWRLAVTGARLLAAVALLGG